MHYDINTETTGQIRTGGGMSMAGDMAFSNLWSITPPENNIDTDMQLAFTFTFFSLSGCVVEHTAASGLLAISAASPRIFSKQPSTYDVTTIILISLFIGLKF